MNQIGRADILAARDRIGGLVRRTPNIDTELAGHPVRLKLELLQHTGSFKPRGALNRILCEDHIPDAGVIAASGGNHGLAVAYAAARLGIRCEIHVAEVTPLVKRERITALGATVTVSGPLYHDALDASRHRTEITGAVEIHAYDHPAVVAGQGTMAVEIEGAVEIETAGGIEANGAPDHILMSVGGGGFAAGTAAWFSDGPTRIVAVEPETSQSLGAALRAGHPVDVEVSGHAADSLGARSIGDVPWSVFSRVPIIHVVVTDEQIRTAQHWLWDQFRLVVEPGGATATAALLAGRWTPEPGTSTVVVVCGANTDPASVM